MKNAWAQIDVQLKRRHDLIPNLVETVKGYMKHERETLEAVTKARNLAQQAVIRRGGRAGQGRRRAELGSWPGCWRWSKATLTSRPTRTSWPSRKS